MLAVLNGIYRKILAERVLVIIGSDAIVEQLIKYTERQS